MCVIINLYMYIATCGGREGFPYEDKYEAIDTGAPGTGGGVSSVRHRAVRLPGARRVLDLLPCLPYPHCQKSMKN